MAVKISWRRKRSTHTQIAIQKQQQEEHRNKRNQQECGKNGKRHKQECLFCLRDMPYACVSLWYHFKSSRSTTVLGFISVAVALLLLHWLSIRRQRAQHSFNIVAAIDIVGIGMFHRACQVQRQTLYGGGRQTDLYSHRTGCR